MLRATIAVSSVVAVWLALRTPFLLVLPGVFLMLYLVQRALSFERVTNPGGGSPRLRRLAGIGGSAVAIVGGHTVMFYSPFGSMIISVATLLFVCALRGVWMTRVPVTPETGERILPDVLLSLMLLGAVGLLASWVEHTYSVWPAIAAIGAAVLLARAVAVERQLVTAHAQLAV